MPCARRFIIVLLLCLACVLIPAMGFGQTPAVEFGVKGGLSCASFFWQVNNSWNDLTMFVFHPVLYGQVVWDVSSLVSLQLECGYAGRGASIDASQEHARWYFNYVEIPLWVKFWERSESLNVYAGAGAYAAWMLAGDYDLDASSVSLSGKGPLTLNGSGSATQAPRLDYGISGTIGGEFGHTIIELRFSVGLPPVLDFLLSDGQRKATNADIQILVGWKP